LAEGVYVDHYCRIACDARIGSDTRILYRAQIFDEVTIGTASLQANWLIERLSAIT
jgi:UDP-3-O-[3-hydroxymyristoyl] glucosamine N-acyltransferase